MGKPDQVNPPALEYNHADIMRQLQNGAERFTKLETLLSTVIEKVEPIPQMQADIAEAKKDIAATKEIVEAWGAIKTAGKFIKWASGVLAGFLAIAAVMRAIAKGLL